MTTPLLLRALSRPLAVAALALTPLAAPAQDGGEAAPVPEAATEAAEPESALPAITVSAVEPRTLRDRVIASGLVAAVEEVQVQPLIEGQSIEALLAEVGDTVEAGEVLARLSPSTLELELSQLRANRAAAAAGLAQAEANIVEATAAAEEAERVGGRARELAEAGTTPAAQAEQAAAAAVAADARLHVAEQGLASAQAQIELADAQIANAELQLARTEVMAPVSGLVVARNAQLGAIASAVGEPMFTLVRDGAMELRAEVSEEDLLKLAPGQPATLVAMGSGEPITGRVRLVEPTIDPQTRLGTARVAIDEPRRVVQGMFLSAEVVAAEAEALAVPVTAVGAAPEGATVMRVRDGVVERAPVTTGIRDGGLIAVTDGLAAGDLVVTKAAAFVRPGDRINPVREDALAQAQGE